jgi:hypothetical protein
MDWQIQQNKKKKEEEEEEEEEYMCQFDTENNTVRDW